jgi:Protein of unknown function (DUF3553)
MQYKKGLRVKNPYAPDWGVGEVLEDTAGNTVSVFFVDAGQKTLSLKDLELVKVDGEEANHPILDNLKIVVDEGLRFRSLPQSIQRFLKEYPGGFYGERFAGNERDYKVNAHRLMSELLNKDGFKALLAKADYDEICRRALKVVNSTNLIFPNEKMALKDGLNSSEDKRRFSEALYSHLFGESDLEKRFMELCDLLYEMKAGKWTTATYFLFFLFPERYMFIKPTITKNSADICAFDIHYRPDLNWTTYEAVLRFSQFLKDALVDLKPRDMIDVQSFMWCIRPDKTLKSFGKKKAKQTSGHESADS